MRVSDGGPSWDPVNGNTYHITTMAVTPASAAGMNASEIEALFSYLDPGAVAQAGHAHTAAAKTLQSIADAHYTTVLSLVQSNAAIALETGASLHLATGVYMVSPSGPAPGAAYSVKKSTGPGAMV